MTSDAEHDVRQAAERERRAWERQCKERTEFVRNEIARINRDYDHARQVRQTPDMVAWQGRMVARQLELEQELAELESKVREEAQR